MTNLPDRHSDLPTSKNENECIRDPRYVNIGRSQSLTSGGNTQPNNFPHHCRITTGSRKLVRCTYTSNAVDSRWRDISKNLRVSSEPNFAGTYLNGRKTSANPIVPAQVVGTNRVNAESWKSGSTPCSMKKFTASLTSQWWDCSAVHSSSIIIMLCQDVNYNHIT